MDSEQAAQPGASRDWVNYAPAGLTGVTLMQAHFTQHAFERHSHAEYGIGVTVSGVQTFNCRGTIQTSGPGHVIFLNPDEAHDGLPGTDNGYRYDMLYVDEAAMSTIRERAAGTSGATYFRDAVVHDVQAANDLRYAIDAVKQSQESLRADTLLLRVFINLFARHGELARAALAPVSAGHSRLRRVRDFIHAHASRDISLNDLAEVANVSRVYLSRVFEQHFGVPPHVYLNSVRLAQARRLLLYGMPLAEIAAATGFADQSHFSRRFKGATGLSPGAWLGQMRLR